MTYREASRKYNLSKSSIARHAHHLKQVGQAAGQAGQKAGQSGTDKRKTLAGQAGHVPGQDNTSQAVLTSVIETLRQEIERQGDTIKQMLQDHAEERKRTDTIIMQLRADIMRLLPAGKAAPGNAPEVQDQGKTETGPAEYKFTLSDRLWLFWQDVKKVLNKRLW